MTSYHSFLRGGALLAVISGLYAGDARSALPRAETAIVRVEAGRVLVERPHSLIGANIEDLNFQLYGGLYSQLLHGECFEEHVDPAELLGLKGPQRFAVWVVLDEEGGPVLRHFPGRSLRLLYEPEGRVDWLRSSPREAAVEQVGALGFRGGVLWPEELPGDLGRRLIALATGDAQVSRHWRRVLTGTAEGSLTLTRRGVFTGKQAQQITFKAGAGEFGIDNAGLFRAGINLIGGRSYEGLLRLKSEAAQTVFLSLRDEYGQVLAEQPIALAARPGEYQRLEFALTPRASSARGRFAIVLKRPGIITVDYAFLQPGEWGRFHGLPVRRDRAEALLSMGVQTMRYNGSMVNRNPVGDRYYKWKQMIGPRDERVPYHGFFNPYASHGFSVFEFMDFCEAAGLLPIFGVRLDETARDMVELVEYCEGNSETAGGRRRIAHGHPRPYFLQAVQIGNEQAPDATYLARFQELATALWSRDPQLEILASVNVRGLAAVGPKGKKGPKAANPAAGEENMIALARWVQAQGRADRFVLDSHYQSSLDHADVALPVSIGYRLHERLAQAVPGFSLRLWPMEENGDRCTWERGLAHAHNLNTMNRLPACLERAGTANTFQADDLALIWDQGRIHFTPSQLFFQPSYHVDRMFADEWLPLVVAAACSDQRLDVLAKKNRPGDVVTVYLVNLGETAAPTVLQIEGFQPRFVSATNIGSEQLDARNTPGEPTRVAPRKAEWGDSVSAPRITLPARSFTSVRLSR